MDVNFEAMTDGCRFKGAALERWRFLLTQECCATSPAMCIAPHSTPR